MTHDDEDFRADLETLIDSVVAGLVNKWLDEIPEDPDPAGWVVDIFVDEPEMTPDQVPEDQRDRYTELIKKFRRFGDAGLEPAREVTAQLTSAMTDHLGPQASSEFEDADRVTDKIAADLAAWTGDVRSTAHRFKVDYMGDLRSSLIFQFDLTRLLKAIMDVHIAIVAEARASVFEIGRQAESRLGAAAAAVEAQAAETVQSVATGIVETTVANIQSGPTGAVTTALNSLAGVAIGAHAVGGDSHDAIHDDIVSALRTLEEKVIHDEELLAEALAELLPYVDGDKMDMLLPWDVNPPPPAEGRPGNPDLS